MSDQLTQDVAWVMAVAGVAMILYAILKWMDGRGL